MTEAGPAPVIVTALLGDRDFAWADGLRRQYFPPERNHLAAHLTLFHHLPPSLLPELTARLMAATRGRAAPAARYVGPMSLGRGVALKIDSPELAEIRRQLAESFAGLLTPQDQAGWRAHVTVQNKVAPAKAKALLARLAVECPPRPIVVAGLAAWYYRGGPWELIRRFPFG